MSKQKQSILFCKDLSFAYIKKNLVLKDVNLDIFKNEFIAIIGPNGGGKTTFLKLICGLLQPQKGELLIFGKKPNHQNQTSKTMSYVPQNVAKKSQIPLSVQEIVLSGLLKSSSLFPKYPKKEKEKAQEILEEMDLLNESKKPFNNLSLGLAECALIARALISNPNLLLLDEPTSYVDTQRSQKILELLKKRSQKTTILMVCHEMSFVSAYVTKVLCIHESVSFHKTERITEKIKKDLYQPKVKIVKHRCQ